MPLLAAAGISAATGVYQMWKGGQQKNEGELAQRKLIKPTYVIPEEIKRNLTESEARALEGLPTEQKKEYVKNLERQQQQTLAAQAERKGGLLGIQQSAQMATDAYTNLVSMDAAARMANQDKLQQSRLNMAAAKEKELAFKEGRYQQGLQSAQAMQGAGMQNQMMGLDTIGSAAIMAGTYYGNQNKPTTT